MIGIRFIGAMVAVAMAASTAPAMAQQSGLTITNEATATLGPPYTLGYTFTATQAQTVIGLGYYDAGGDGLADSHPVGLWDSTGTLLTSGTVGSGTTGTLLDSFRYTSVAPYTLAAGQNYYVGGLDAANGGDPYVYNSTATTANGITYVTDGYHAGATLAFADSSDGSDAASAAYFGGTILLASAAPEPASWALMILGFGIAGTVLRRRSRGLGAGPVAA